MDTSLPPGFSAVLERYRPYLTQLEFDELVNASTKPAPSAVRVNLLKPVDPTERLSGWSEQYGWETQSLPYSPVSRQVVQAETPPGQTLEHRLGYYYVQDAASILPVSLFSPVEPGALLLDMAASPGGKTTQMIDLVCDGAFVLANDSAGARLPALRTVLQTWGASNLAITNFAGEKLGEWFPGRFDRVLLDAPCSMESLRVSASHPIRQITEGERERLAARQLALLVSAVKAARLGGEIVYSTCTMAPEEDEAVVDALLKRYPGTARIDDKAAAQYQLHGLTEFLGAAYDPELARSLRVWPTSFGTNGFFAVKLIKQADLAPNELQKPARPFSSTGYSPLTQRETADLRAQINNLYAFDFSESERFRWYRRESDIQLIPSGYLDHFAELPYHALGMPLGRVIHAKLEVSPEFVNRFGDQFQANTWEIPKEYLAAWIRGADLRGLDFGSLQLGQIAVLRTREGLNVGPGKLSQGRLRNMLPRRNLLL